MRRNIKITPQVSTTSLIKNLNAQYLNGVAESSFQRYYRLRDISDFGTHHLILCLASDGTTDFNGSLWFGKFVAIRNSNHIIPYLYVADLFCTGCYRFNDVYYKPIIDIQHEDTDKRKFLVHGIYKVTYKDVDYLSLKYSSGMSGSIIINAIQSNFAPFIVTNTDIPNITSETLLYEYKPDEES